MTRPKRETVEYFPHYCSPSKTLFILQDQFSNDGYAFYYKLRELLGDSEGHAYPLHKAADWQYLAARTGVTQVQAKEILDTMAGLEAIDRNLYDSGVIWSPGFIDILEPLYSRRKTEPPVKPDINTPQLSLTPADTPASKPNSDNNRQSKVKESKVKKVNTSKPDIKSLESLKDPKYLKPLYADYTELVVTRELERFKNHLKAKGKRYKDYRAAFRNWLSSPYQGNNGDSKTQEDKKYYFAECPECHHRLVVDSLDTYKACPKCKLRPKMDVFVMNATQVKKYLANKKKVEV